MARRRQNFGRLLTALTCAIVVQPVILLAATDFEKRLGSTLALLDERNFNGVIGLSAPGQPTLFSAIGFTKRISKDPRVIQIDLLSITKTLTATAIMRLVEQNLLATNQTLGDIFPTVPADKTDITVHQLLTHSAGFKSALGRDSEILLKDAFLNRAFASKLQFPPGERYAYSNVGYSILAAIVERVSKTTYEEYLADELLQAHGDLEFGYVNVFDSDRSIRTNPGLHIDKASWGHRQVYWNLIGNGGLISTARSMLVFQRRLLAGEIVSLDSVAAMHTPFVRELPAATHYGYGLVVEDHPEFGELYWHNGGNRHFSAHWANYADRHTLMFAAGTGQPDASWVVETLATCLFSEPVVCEP